LRTLEVCRQSYTKARDEYVLQIRKDKNASWQNFLKTESNKDPSSVPFKIARNRFHNSVQMCSLACPDGRITKNWKESLEALLTKCVSPDARLNDEMEH
jgi:hypothetical protein